MNDNAPKPYQPPELTLETRVLAVTVGLIIVGVLLLKLGLDVSQLDRRMTAIEAAVQRITKLHEVP